jgi:transposase
MPSSYHSPAPAIRETSAVTKAGAEPATDHRCPLCGNLTGPITPQRRRAEALQLHASGVAASDIASRLGVTRMAVYHWIKLYAPDGLLLKRRRRGRRPAIGPRELKRLRALTRSNPQVYGIKRDGWSSPALAELIVKIFHVRVSPGSALRLKRRLSNGSS